MSWLVDRASIQPNVFQIVAEQVGEKPENLTRDTKLKDIDCDSLDLEDIFYILELKFNFLVPSRFNNRPFTTVGEICAMVAECVESF